MLYYKKQKGSATDQSNAEPRLEGKYLIYFYYLTLSGVLPNG